jgi:aspartate aminotransferase
VWTKAQLEGIADFLDAHPQLVALYDGIYESLVYDGAVYHELAALRPGLSERVVCVNGVSKSYAMTGWRIGWALGPVALMKAAAKLQSQTTSAPNTMAQWAAKAALALDPEIIEGMRRSFDDRRKLACSLLTTIPGAKLSRPQGAFYCFVDLNAYIGARHNQGDAIRDDVDLATYLLESVGVALVPGSAFGAGGFMRITYACDEESIRRGIERIGEALLKLQR